MNIKIKILLVDKDRDYIVEEVDAEPCKDLPNCAWVEKYGVWHIYDVKTGRVFYMSDSRAYLEARMNEFQRMLEVHRQSDIYKRRVQQFREIAGI